MIIETKFDIGDKVVIDVLEDLKGRGRINLGRKKWDKV